MDAQCTAIKRSGSRCEVRALPGSRFCFAHDPALQQRRQDGAAKGGRNRANSQRARKAVLANGLELDEIDRALCGALARILTGRMEPNIGTAAASLTRTIIAIRQAGEVETRLQALESANEGKAS